PATVTAPPQTPSSSPQPAARSGRGTGNIMRPGSDFRSSLARAHRDGIRTPMLDYVIANKDRLKASAGDRNRRRRYWMIAIAISFFVLFPLALLLLVAWIASELNHLKPPQVSLQDFVRQFFAELRRVAQHQKTQT